MYGEVSSGLVMKNCELLVSAPLLAMRQDARAREPQIGVVIVVELGPRAALPVVGGRAGLGHEVLDDAEKRLIVVVPGC